MIIDLHTHSWTSIDQLGPELADRLRAVRAQPWGHLDAGPVAHERAMSCVDGALVLGFRSDRLGARIPNEFIAELIAKDPRRRVGAAGIDPMSSDALEQVERALAMGLVGVTIAPACQGFHPAHTEAMRVYDRCAALGLPVFVTQGVPAMPRASVAESGATAVVGGSLPASAILEFARPALWDEVAAAFPKLPIVISRLGHPWIDETLVLLAKHPNVYADIAGVVSRPWQLYNALLSATSLGVMDKLLFGSGFPGEGPAKAIEALYSINSYSHGTPLPAVPRTQLRGIVERDSLAQLGIDAEIAPHHEAEGEARPLVTVIKGREDPEAAPDRQPAGPNP
ncbi:MAG: amidohydrolase family protein [Planctomycetota bacterium]|jgi:predicted TIM-barrel fold metal-dependent hydrolase